VQGISAYPSVTNTGEPKTPAGEYDGLETEIKLLYCCLDTDFFKLPITTQFTNTVTYSVHSPIPNKLIKLNQTTATPSVDRKQRFAATGDK
jgi:hypothetical protein